MAALPQQTVPDEEITRPRPATWIFRVPPVATPPMYYRRRPLIRLSCPRPPALPARPSDPPQISLVAPLPGLAALDRPDQDNRFDPGDEPPAAAPSVDPASSDYPAGLDAWYGEAADPPTNEAPESAAVGAPPTRRGSGLLLAMVGVAVLVILGLTGFIVAQRSHVAGHHSDPRAGGLGAAVVPVSPAAGSAPAPAGSADADPSGQAIGWIADNLPASTKLLADPAIRAGLVTEAGRAGNVGDFTDAAGQSSATYLIVTPTVRQAGTEPGSAVARMLAGALPVAVFGDGQERIEISQLGAMGTSLSTARQARVLAGQGLARNRQVTVDPGLADPISEGWLDLRAATTLAVLADQAQVQVLALPQSAPEQRAGAPIRILRFALTGTADPAGLVAQTVSALPPNMRPMSSSRRPDGSFQISWLPDLALTPPVN